MLLPNEYSVPVLALIFLKYADHRFAQVEAELTGKGRRHAISKDDYIGRHVVYVPPEACFERLQKLPPAFEPAAYEQLCQAVFDHVYESYYGEGQSKYHQGGATAPS